MVSSKRFTIYKLSGCLGSGGKGRGGGQKVPTAHNYKCIHGIQMKFGRVVENRKLINLM